MSEEREMVGGGDWWEGEGGVGWGGKNISSVLPLRGLDMWKRWGRESRCMGIQKSLHMHATQTYTACYGLRKNNSQEGQQAVDTKDWNGGKLWPL